MVSLVILDIAIPVIVNIYVILNIAIPRIVNMLIMLVIFNSAFSELWGLDEDWVYSKPTMRTFELLSNCCPLKPISFKII